MNIKKIQGRLLANNFKSAVGYDADGTTHTVNEAKKVGESILVTFKNYNGVLPLVAGKADGEIEVNLPLVTLHLPYGCKLVIEF